MFPGDHVFTGYAITYDVVFSPRATRPVFFNSMFASVTPAGVRESMFSGA
jgi:hypothetical protein